MKDWISGIVEGCVESAFVVGKERMFLSGKNKVKLQLWQFLLLFDSEVIIDSLGPHKFHNLLLRLIEGLNITMINEVRYYFELFLMRLLSNRSGFKHK